MEIEWENGSVEKNEWKVFLLLTTKHLHLFQHSKELKNEATRKRDRSFKKKRSSSPTQVTMTDLHFHAKLYQKNVRKHIRVIGRALAKTFKFFCK